jgi:ribosomal protein S7
MVMGEEGKILAAEKLLALALGKGRQKPYFPALKYLFDRTDGEPIKAIQAAVENWKPPIVVVSKKEAETGGEHPVEPPAETG